MRILVTRNGDGGGLYPGERKRERDGWIEWLEKLAGIIGLFTHVTLGLNVVIRLVLIPYSARPLYAS